MARIRSSTRQWTTILLVICVVLTGCSSGLINDKLSLSAVNPSKIQAINIVYSSRYGYVQKAAHRSGASFNWSNPQPVRGVSNLWNIVGRTGNIHFNVYLSYYAGKLEVNRVYLPRLGKLEPMSGGKSRFTVSYGSSKVQVISGVVAATTSQLKTMSLSQAQYKTLSATGGTASNTSTLSGILTPSGSFKVSATRSVAGGQLKVADTSKLLSAQDHCNPHPLYCPPHDHPDPPPPCEEENCSSWRLAKEFVEAVGMGAVTFSSVGGTYLTCTNPATIIGCPAAAYGSYELTKTYSNQLRDVNEAAEDLEDCRNRQRDC